MRHEKRISRVLLLGCTLLLAAAVLSAQESTSKPDGNSDSVPKVSGGPGGALKGVLSAACGQNQNEFARYLTARNKEAFSRMTPQARLALMKRFVLLNEPGKATSSSNPSGRPLVTCTTPDVVTEMQIGGAELRDNIAFLPMELRDATDSTGANVHQVTMGLVREDGEWKLLSLGLLLLDIPALEVEWDVAEIDSTEKDAIESLNKIASAIEAYRTKYPRLPESLEKLGPPVRGGATPAAAGLLDADLAKGLKNGYKFRYVILGADTLGAPAKYELAATPLQYGRTGVRSFFRDAAGVIHGADRNGAIGNGADPKVDTEASSAPPG